MIAESLEHLKNNFYSNASKEVLGVIDKSISDLLKSKLNERAIKVGCEIPDFVLKNAVGNHVDLDNLLKKGPLVINFYRGAW